MREVKAVAQTQAYLLSTATCDLATESIAWPDLYGRVLAETLLAPRDIPAFAASKMDGIAIHHSSLGEAAHSLSASFTLSQRITAGMVPEPLVAGSAARIFTGAPLPSGADTVIPQELCQFNTDIGAVEVINATVAAGQFVRGRGSDVRAGQEVLQAGARVHARHLAQIASLGVGQCRVYRSLRVGILSTGNEVLEPGETFRAGAVYDANRPLLAGLLQDMGLTVVDLGCVQDSSGDLAEALTTGSDCDVVILSGGMSVGEEDHVKQVVQRYGQFDFWRVNVKPGKPFAYGSIRRNQCDTPIFGLPGNPVAVLVTFLLFVRPYLLKASGRSEVHTPWQTVTIAGPISAGPRETYMRVRWHGGDLEPHANQDSGSVSAMAESTGLLRLPAAQSFKEGDCLEYVDYRSLLW